MRTFIITIAFVLLSSSAWAQSTPVCSVFTDAEVTDLLGKPATTKRHVLAPESDCLWGFMGFMFTVNRMTDDDPEIVKSVVEGRTLGRGVDVVKAEPGIGDAAFSVQGQYGRSTSIVFRSGKSAWVMNLEKVDQKLDVAAALPKLRALAKKAAGAR